MLDKAVERSRANSVTRQLPGVLAKFGFEASASSGGAAVVDGHTWRVWLQKFRHQPAFRVAMSFTARDGQAPAVEFADRWTCRDSPAGRKFDFGLGGGDDAADRCLREIRDFVEVVAIPWFKSQAASAAQARG
jgi:hypothetical protein